jgi:hypothetical protein
MYCQECGQELADGADFCRECGTAVATGTDGGTPTQTGPQEQASVDVSESEGTGWPLTRKLAGLAGAVAIVSLFLSWYTEASAQVGGRRVSAGSFSANALSLEITPIVLAATGVAVLFMLLSWGRGWGRLTMLLSAVGGAGMVYIDVAALSILDASYTFATVTVRGQEIPAAALDPGIGLFVHAAAGAGFVLFGLAGLVGSFFGG